MVNASEMATSLEFASKIATVVNLFKFEFPDAKSDLKPWCNDPETLNLVDPDSIDIGFHFPGVSKSWRSRSILIQIRIYQDLCNELKRRAIGIEVAGFNHLGEQWRLSTINDWSFVGKVEPSGEIGEKLKLFCRQVLEVFNQQGE
ncbi:Polyketide synthase modules and related proteins [Richelia intracellularis]|nr:Polyketide synthase modules and related proteins [Richelia intracellularis]